MNTLPQNPYSDTHISLPECAQMFKAIGDETRIRILGLLRHGELCVCDIMEVLKLPQSTASRHLAYLRNSNWVNGTRRGKWMYYRLCEDTFEKSVSRSIIEFLSSIPQILDDYRNLQHHLQQKDKGKCK